MPSTAWAAGFSCSSMSWQARNLFSCVSCWATFASRNQLPEMAQFQLTVDSTLSFSCGVGVQ